MFNFYWATTCMWQQEINTEHTNCLVQHGCWKGVKSVGHFLNNLVPSLACFYHLSAFTVIAEKW